MAFAGGTNWGAGIAIVVVIVLLLIALGIVF